MKQSTTISYFTLLFAGLFLIISCNHKPPVNHSGWEQLPEILQHIQPPVFPDKDFSILDYGAKEGGTFDCLPAIDKAIAACHAAGGGRVVIPEGTYLVKGPIHLKNNVNLHLDKGAVVRFSTDPDDYLPVVYTRFEGVELMNYSPLIYAYGKQNIAVTGEGILDGQAGKQNWWTWRGSKRYGWKEGMPSQLDSANRPAMAQMAIRRVPVRRRIFGKDHFLRPSFLEFYKCKNILIKGITLKRSPFWIVHPTLSQNITIDGITVNSHGPNNDGCDPESCQNVLIKNCTFNTGDDCLSIKSGKNADGRRVNVPSKNIIIQNCKMKDGHGGVVIGSGTSGGIENVFVENCQMNSPRLTRAIRFKSNACRGGLMKNFYFRNIHVGEVDKAVIGIDMFYPYNRVGNCHFPPVLDSVFIDHVTSEESEYAINIRGRKDKPVNHIFIQNCDFKKVEKKNIIQQAENIKIIHSTINGKKVNVE